MSNFNCKNCPIRPSPHGNVVEVRLLPRCVRLSSRCLLGRRPICPSVGSSNQENSSTLEQPQHRSVSPRRQAEGNMGRSDRYTLAAVQRTRQVHPQQTSVRSRAEIYFMLSSDGTLKVWDGRLFSLFVMCDRSLRTVPCHSFYAVSKIEVTGESLANVRTKWEAVEQRAQPFFEDHYDWPESIPHIL